MTEDAGASDKTSLEATHSQGTGSDDPAGWDGKTFEPERAKAALENSRAEAKAARQDKQRYGNVLRGLGINPEKLAPELGAEPEGGSAQSPEPDPTIASLAEILGVDAADPASILEAVESLKRRPKGPSSAPMPGGSASGPPLISREALQYLSPEQITELRAAGALEHLSVGRGDKR